MFCWKCILKPELLLIKNLIIMGSSNFEKQGKTEIGLKLVTRVLFPFLKIRVTRAIFNLSGKTPFAKEILKICFRVTPFAKEILKICFRVTNISSDTLLTTLADISSYAELFFLLRLANAFASPKLVRLMVLRTTVLNIVLEWRFAFGNGGS